MKVINILTEEEEKEIKHHTIELCTDFYRIIGQCLLQEGMQQACTLQLMELALKCKNRIIEGIVNNAIKRYEKEHK